MTSPGLLVASSFSFESLVRLKIIRLMFLELGFGVRSNSGRREKFTDYQREVVVLNCLQAKLMLVSVYCICKFIEVSNQH